MSISRQEEVIAALWFIAALVAFGNGFKICAWIFLIKGGLDSVCAIGYAVKEILAERGKK